MGYDLFAIQEPGQPESWDHPGLNDDLSLRWEAIDGQVLGPFVATSVKETIRDSRKDKYVKECEVEETKIYFYLTESRFAFVCPKYDKGGGWWGTDAVSLSVALVANAVSKARAAHRSHGTALVGQIRHPWVWCVQFEQKTGWLSDEAMRVYYTDPDGPSRYVEIIFDKHEDAAEIAFNLKQRIVGYRLSDRDPKDDAVRAKLDALLAVGPSTSPRGELVNYDTSVGEHFLAGKGESVAPLYPPSSGKNLPVAAPSPTPEQPAPEPREQKNWHGIVSTLEPNEPEDWSWPTLNDDLTIRSDALDGDVIGPLTATNITNYVIRVKGGKPKLDRDCWVVDNDIRVFITEARVAYVCTDTDTDAGAPRTARAGQLRYPWVYSVQFLTKQNWLTDEMLRFFYEDDDGVQVLSVTLNKKHSAAALAATLVQRIASYHLAANDPKDASIIEKLESMRADPHLPASGKFEYTEVEMPVYSPSGSGEENAPKDAPSRVLGSAVPAQTGPPQDTPAQDTPAQASPTQAGPAPTPEQASPALTPTGTRFNPPPNWPTPPPGWAPDADWQPDPSWPSAPPGWRFWV